MIYKKSENAILYSAAPVESLAVIIGKAVKAVFSCEENGFHNGPSNRKSVSFFEKKVAKIVSQSLRSVNE